MAQFELVVSLAVAVGVGLIIGLQREHSASATVREDLSFVGGIRTYPLFALAGALAALASQGTSYWIIAACLVALMIPVSIAYADGLRRNADRGITSEVALVVTYLLGVLAVSNQVIPSGSERLLLVAGVAVAVTALLALKEPLHTLASKFSRDDMYTTLKFLVLAVIVLPLLPDESYGPFKVLNPFKIGLMIVLFAGVGLIGYVLVRVLGPGRGMGLAGLVGGLASSTAVTMSVSRRARSESATMHACILAVVLASTVMPMRVILEVLAVDPPLTLYVAMPMIAMALSGAVIGYFIYRRMPQKGEKSHEIAFRNPLELSVAIYFGLLFGIISLVSKAAIAYFGKGGFYASAAISGLVDLDAISLSIANMARTNTVGPVSATLAILLGVTSNTIVKALIAVLLGGWSYGWRVWLAFVLTLLAGTAALILVWRFF